MALTIDNLEIQIQTNAANATSGVDSLANSLRNLKAAVGDTSGLVGSLTQISTALKTFSGIGRINIGSTINQLARLQELIPILGSGSATTLAQNLTSISVGLTALSSVPKVSITHIANGIASLNTATASFDTARLAQFSEQMKGIAAGLAQLGTIPKSNLGSMLNQLMRIPEIVKTLDPTVIDQFANAMRRLSEALEPLASQMSRVSRGFGAMPKNVRQATKASEGAVVANGRLTTSYQSLFAVLSRTMSRFWTLYYTFQRIASVMGEMYNESNEFIENLNLFTVSMGDATDSAMKFAETVRDAMGIDLSEWIFNQGTFQRMATGFGIAAEQAEIMSQGLTQLAYDMSSFFNTDVETAMQKLQSGMSGQIKGLKAWGYNLSVAALEETALSLGIKESVRNMTEAQKAQLRYITLIQRSSGVMGDMARTINTPANAMRILSAQLTRVKRAFGNLISIIATKVIPYVQAFCELIEEGVNSLATSMGFELTEIDYSNLELAEEVIDGIGDSVEDTEDEIQALKKQLMGFDELNILKSNESDISDNIEGASYDLGIEMPTYDFLAGLDGAAREKVNAIKETIREFADELGRIIPLLSTVGKILSVGWAVTGIYNAIMALEKFIFMMKVLYGPTVTTSTALSVMGQAALTGATGFGALGLKLKALGTRFKTFFSNLSPITKSIISIAALVAEFVVVKNAVKDAVDGTSSWGESLLKIIPICGLVGAAMYAMWGPIGIVAAAVVGLVGAIVGFVEAEKEMRRELVKSTFFDDYGKTLNELSGEYDDLLDSITKTHKGVVDSFEDFLESKTNVEETAEAVGLLVWEVENGATAIDAAVGTITDAFAKLADSSKTLLGDSKEVITGALSGSIGDVLKKFGADLGEYGAATGLVTEEALKYIDNQNALASAKKEKLDAGEITNTEYWDSMLDISNNIAELTGADDNISGAINDAKENLKTTIADIFADGIDWGDSESLKSGIEGFVTATDEAKKTITSSYKSLSEALDVQLAAANALGKTDEASVLTEFIGKLEEAMASDLAEIDDLFGSVADHLQANLLGEMADIYEEAGNYYDSRTIGKLFITKTGDVRRFLADYKDGEFAAAIEALEQYFKGYDIWADDKFGELASYLEELPIKDYRGDLYNAFGEQLEDTPENVRLIIESALPDGVELSKEFLPTAAEEAAFNAVKGIANGLTDGQGAVYNAALVVGQSVEDGYNEALDINSPSVVMYDRGKDTIQGLVNGISDTSLLSAAIENIIDKFDILSPIKELWRKVSDWWKNLSLPDIDLFGGFGAKIAGAFNIGQYASGGFPSMGQMFIARERGPELVGRIGNKNAVANNDQIISGIASAVYGAMMAANEDSDNGGGSARIVVQIGDQAVGEASIRYINGRIVQTGESPLYT